MQHFSDGLTTLFWHFTVYQETKGLVLKHAMLIAVSHMKGTSKYQTSKKVESLDLSSNFGLVNLVLSYFA